ncbi:MAG: tRNA lysidine(34) synthetase TilS [Oscillospiraceae bacterium]|nr:tRNA lysidine(34) synthetase TilS [Oscillospiraceae bacterium]MBQ6402926.1 tRNA lysidine(34) synthetase TilS [Oscillospiraceae bacterium]
MNIDPVRRADRVLCAVSGGADSMCLLAQMLERAPQKGFAVLCAHFDHRQRGEESQRDADFVRAFCAEHAVPCFVEAYEGERHDEAALRAARYAFLCRIAKEQNCRWIATAHTADDQLETMLLNLARGSGLRGMSGIAPVQGELLRPMLDMTRADVEAYLTSHQISHVEDSTNAADAYARNRLRHAAVPAMQSVNAQAVRHAAETAALLREDADYLDSLAREAMDAPLEALRALPRPIRARVFRLRFGAGLTKQHIESLHAFIQADGPAALDLPGVRVLREQGRLCSASLLPPLPEISLTPGQTYDLPAHGFCITVSETDTLPEIYDSFTVYRFKSAEIRGKLTLTARRPGDAIRLHGRGCTKRLSDLFLEAGVPASERDFVPVLRDDLGPAAVYGFGVAERLTPTRGAPSITVKMEKERHGEDQFAPGHF